MTRVLGLDLGISGARAAVLDGDGRCLGRGVAPCVHRPAAAAGAGAGVAEHDPRAWRDEIDAAAREAVAAAGIEAVDAIAVGGLGPAPVLLDDALEPLRPAPLFSLDARAEPFRRALVEEHGDVVGPDHVLPRLAAWRADEPVIVERARWVVDATGYLVGSLVGRAVMDRITAADYVAGDASPDVAVPEAEEPLAIAGHLTAAAAERLGVRPGAPVTVGTYDTFVDLAALPATAGQLLVLLGSTLVVGAVVPEGTPVPEGLRPCPHVGAGPFVGGWTAAAGSAIAWASGLVAFDRRDDLERAVEALAPGTSGLLALPSLAGERAPVWDPHASGALIGLSLDTSPADVARAFVDGVALSTLDLVDRLAPIVDARAPAWVSGGGVRHRAWLAATADALGTPLRAATDLAGGVAAARFALRAIGEPPLAVATVTAEPDPVRHETYRELLAIRRGLYAATSDAMHALREVRARMSPAEGPTA